MKKILLLLLFFLIPLTTWADFASGWTATSTTQGSIFPTKINGIFPYIQVPYIRSTSTASSTFAGGIDATTICLKGTTVCLSASGSGSGTVGSGLTGQFPYYAANGTTLTATSSIFLDSINDRIGLSTTTPDARLSFPDATIAAGGIKFGSDVNLYRSGTNILRTDDAMVANSGFFAPDAVGFQNSSTGNNASYFTNTNGPLIRRNIADSNPSLIVQQLNAGSTGDVLQLKNNASTIFVASQIGNIGISSTTPGTLLSLGITGGINITPTATSTFNKAIQATCFTVDGTSCITGTGGSGSGTVSAGLQGQNAFYNADGTTVSGTSTLFMAQNQKIGIGTTTPTSMLHIDTGTNDINTPLYISGNVNDFQQVVAQNVSNGGNASAGFTVCNDEDPLNSGCPNHYAEFVMDSSGFNTTPSGASVPAIISSSTAPFQFTNINANSDWQVYTQGNPGTLRLIVKAGGNIGIGTSTPRSLLDLNASDTGTNILTQSNAMLAIRNADTTNGNFEDLAFQTTDLTNGNSTTTSAIKGVNTLHTANAVSGDMIFINNNVGTTSETMRLLANGSVAVGTSSSPASQMYIKNRGNFTNVLTGLANGGTPSFSISDGGSFTTAGTVTWSGQNNSMGNNNFSFNGNAVNTISSTNSGTAAATLIIGGANASSTLTFQTTSGVGTTDFIDFVGGNNGATKIMRIKGTGAIGMGTSTPVNRLDVAASGTGGNTMGIRETGTGTNDFAGINYYNTTTSCNGINFLTTANYTTLPEVGGGGFGIYNSCTGGITFMADNASGALKFVVSGQTVANEAMRIIANRNVGIGSTTPVAKLTIGTHNQSGLNPQFLVASSSTGIATSTDLVVVNSNTGIGTSSPWRKFSVVGTVSINGLTSETGDNAVCINATNEIVNSTGLTCQLSSMFFKHDIEDLTYEEAKHDVEGLRAVKFELNKGDIKNVGFIAEEVEKIDPRLVDHATKDVTTDGHFFKKGDPVGVLYGNITAVLIKYQQGQTTTENPKDGKLQMVGFGLLVLGFFYQNMKIRKLKK